MKNIIKNINLSMRKKEKTFCITGAVTQKKCISLINYLARYYCRFKKVCVLDLDIFKNYDGYEEVLEIKKVEKIDMNITLENLKVIAETGFLKKYIESLTMSFDILLVNVPPITRCAYSEYVASILDKTVLIEMDTSVDECLIDEAIETLEDNNISYITRTYLNSYQKEINNR